MNETDTPTSQRERLKVQRQFEKKKAHMASIWQAWREFEKNLDEHQPRYLRLLYDTVQKISQEIVIAKTAHGQRIAWDQGRDRVVTFNFLERTALTYGKSHATIQSDIGKVASHNSWMHGVNQRGEFRILAMVQKELFECDLKVHPIQFEPPACSPILMNAAQINRLVADGNKRFQELDRELRAETVPIPKTTLMDFVTDVDRQARYSEIRRRRPRRNWKKEL